MKIIWHLAKKDLLRLRWAWLLWTLLLVGEIALAELLLSSRSLDVEFFTRGTMVASLLFLAHVLVCGLIVSFAVLEDRPTGDDSFWLTRPIAGWQLLTGKLGAMLVLFWVWPVVVALPWWIYSDVRGADLANAALRAGLLNLTVLAPSWALAAVAKNYGRFLLAVFLCGLTILVLMLVAATSLTGQAGRGMSNLGLTAPLALAYATCVIVVLVQYLTRAVKWAKGLFFMGGLTAAALVWMDPRGAWFSAPAPVMPLPGGGELKPRFTGHHFYLANPGEARLRLDFYVPGGKQEIALLGGMAKCRFTWSDGVTYETEAPLAKGFDALAPVFFGIERSQPDKETEAKRAQMLTERRRQMAASGLRFETPEPSPWDGSGRQRWLQLTLPVDVAERFAAEPPRAEFEFRFGFGRSQQVAKVRLKSQKSVKEAGVRLAVLEVKHTLSPEKKRRQDAVDIVLVYAASEYLQFHQIDWAQGMVYPFTDAYGIDIPLVPLSRRVMRVGLQAYVPTLWRTDHWVPDLESVNRSDLVVTATPRIGYAGAKLNLDALKLDFIRRGPETEATSDD